MKKFNKVITVEVSVDAIAQKMLDSIKADNPHAELITEAIIGSAIATDKLSYIYNALNGFTNDIDFQVGQVVNTEEEVYQWVDKRVENADEPNWKQERAPIGDCTIDEIDVYRAKENVKVRFCIYNRSGVLEPETKWVSHLKLKTAVTSPAVNQGSVAMEPAH